MPNIDLHNAIHRYVSQAVAVLGADVQGYDLLDLISRNLTNVSLHDLQAALAEGAIEGIALSPRLNGTIAALRQARQYAIEIPCLHDYKLACKIVGVLNTDYTSCVVCYDAYNNNKVRITATDIDTLYAAAKTATDLLKKH